MNFVRFYFMVCVSLSYYMRDQLLYRSGGKMQFFPLPREREDNSRGRDVQYKAQRAAKVKDRNWQGGWLVGWRADRWWIWSEHIKENKRMKVHTPDIRGSLGQRGWRRKVDVLTVDTKGWKVGRGGQIGWETASGVSRPLTCEEKQAKLAICWVVTENLTGSPAWESPVLTAGWKNVHQTPASQYLLWLMS